ncbi:MAG TPA: hypothetical protein VF030_10410, partial [Solirubrobacterales bacterium]
SPQTKGTAESAKRAAEWTRSACGGLGIGDNPRYLYVAFFFDLVAIVAGEIAADPPRKDFTVSARVRPRFATPQYIETPEHDDEVLLATAAAADSAELYLAAHLRAFERMQGALQADKGAEARQRAEEAVEHAHSSGRALEELAARTRELAEIQPQAESARARREGRPHLPEVSREAHSILFLGGLRIRDLKQVLQGTNLEDAAVANQRFAESSLSFQAFGEEMSGWTPPSEPALSL